MPTAKISSSFSLSVRLHLIGLNKSLNYAL